MALQRPKNKLGLKLLLALFSVLLTYTLADAVYRTHRYVTLQKYVNYWISTTDAPVYQFDEDLGFRYQANTDTTGRGFSDSDQSMGTISMRFNNYGHASPHDDALPKSASEYRLAVLGDSFTHCRTSDGNPWPTLLEQLLNQDQALKKGTGVSTFKVINFGMDGTGIVQWDKVYDKEVTRFGPDLVLVNFISHDIVRKFIWRKTVRLNTPRSAKYQVVLTSSSLPVDLNNRECVFARQIVVPPEVCADAHELSLIKQEIYQYQLQRLQWFAPYPELLAKLGEPRIGLQQRLSMNGSFNPSHAPKKGISLSLATLRSIKKKHPNVLILHNPGYEEIVDRKPCSDAQEFLRKGADLGIVQMGNTLPAASKAEVEQWFKLPDDFHFSERGAEMYARAVHQIVSGRLEHP
jgi:hypothetical protein